MPNPELTQDFSRWLGILMIPSPNDPEFFRSDPQDGIVLTEEAALEPSRGKKKKTFWSVVIQVENFHATGTGFDRAEARDEAWSKLKELVSPLVQKFERLGFLPPN